MAFNGSGAYLVPPGTQGIPGAIIDSTKYNAFLTDLQTALSLVLPRDGQSAALANIAMAGFKFTGLGPGAVAGDSARYEQLIQHPAAAYTVPVAVVFAANLTIDASLSNMFTVGALTANLTGLTITNPGNGQTITIRFLQDATGGRTVAGPAGSAIVSSVGLTAAKASLLTLTFTATAGRWEGSWLQLP